MFFTLFFIPVLFNTDDLQPFILLSDQRDYDEPRKDLGSCTECLTNGIDVTFPSRKKKPRQKVGKSRENKMEAGRMKLLSVTCRHREDDSHFRTEN